MNTPSLESRLKQAALTAAQPRSLVTDIMHNLPATSPQLPARKPWLRPLLATALTAIAASLILLFFFTTTTPQFTLAEVQSAVEQQSWVHITWDTGPKKEEWINLQTGDHSVISTFQNNLFYTNQKTNTVSSYSKNNGVIYQSPATTKPATPYTSQTAWQEIIDPLLKSAAAQPATQPAQPIVTQAPDTLNNTSVIRFDTYQSDALGNRYLSSQLWADPHTRLPLQIKTHLQLADRQQFHQDFATGTYDFPPTGPADLYSLGTPKNTPIKSLVTATPDIQPLLAAITQSRANFLQNYKAAVTITTSHSHQPIAELHTFWRDHDKIREDYFELDNARSIDPTLPQKPDLDAYLIWASKNKPASIQFSDGLHDYIRSNTADPYVQVIPHQIHPLFDPRAFIDHIQWPTYGWAPNFTLLLTDPADTDAPPNTLHLQFGGQGDYRADYYIDPKQDHICLKNIQWLKFKNQWQKDREFTLSNLHLVAGRFVATTQTLHIYPNPLYKTAEELHTYTIYISPITSPAAYPEKIFDPTTITTGAKIKSD